MDYSQLLVVALIVEAVWETCKMFWQDGKISVDRIGAVLFGVFLCVAAGVDFFAMVGLPLVIPFVGAVLSGLLVSRGANFIHDLFGAVEKTRGTFS